MSPQRLGSARQNVNERLRHQQWLVENLVELGDATRQIDVRTDHREVKPAARAHVAIRRLTEMGSPDRTGTDSLQADKAGTSGGCQGGQGCRAAPESPETVGVKFAVAGPEVIAGEIDVAPAQGREMGEDGLRHWDTVPT